MENTNLKIECHKLNDDGSMVYQSMSNLDGLIWNGVYIIRAFNDNGSWGLPFTLADNEAVNLVVKDQAPKEEATTDAKRTVVQTVTRVEKETGEVLTYSRTRTCRDGELCWSKWSRLGGVISVVNHTATTVSIMPNVMNVWGEVLNLNISLVEPADKSLVNEYMIQFVSGEVATTLTLPDSIKWVNNNIPAIATNKIYQISILNGLAVCLEFYN